jgi:steroid 5-alpha reductase family enzyme
VAYLAYREICLPRFRDFRERIEERAKSRGSRLGRTPFILSCALLYGLMCVPFLVTAKVAASSVSMVGPKWALQGLKGAMAMTWAGFGLGAIGDVTKSIRKAQRGEDALITGGVYRWFRHPNYTGELFGWTSSCIAAFFAVILSSEQRKWWIFAPYLAASVAGAAGIGFVLTMATSGLEERQLEKYGSTQEYKDWVKQSWAGIQLSKKPKEPEEFSE